jgi:hypothetical protein
MVKIPSIHRIRQIERTRNQKGQREFRKTLHPAYRPGGEIIEMDTDGGNRRTLVGNLLGNVDGIVIDKKTKTLYWTNMGPASGPSEGEFFQADGSIECIGLNGANRRMLVGHSLTVTPKQVTADFDTGLLYWCDREGMRVMRSNLDGSNVTVLVRNGVFPADSQDVPRHCVGIAAWPSSRCRLAGSG